MNTLDSDVKGVLLLGNYRTSLPIARQLKRLGHTVAVGTDHAVSVWSSNAVDIRWKHSIADGRSDDFRSELQTFLDSHPEINAILPVMEHAICAMLPYLHTINVHWLMTEPRLFLDCMNKSYMAGQAKRSGVPQTETAEATSLETIASAAEKVGFPCIARPADGRPANVKAYYIADRQNLTQVFPDWPDNHDTLVLQRFIHGTRFNRYFIAQQGRVLNYVEVRTGRTDHASGFGYAVEGVSVPPNHALDDTFQNLLGNLDYTGVGCIQYLVEKSTGQVSFLELNARIGGNYTFPHVLGLDQVGAMIDMASGRDLSTWSAPLNYPLGKRFAWTSGDLTGLLQSAAQGSLSLRHGLGWLWACARNGVTANVHITWDRHDPRPSIFITKQVIVAVAAASRAKLRGALRRVRGR